MKENWFITEKDSTGIYAARHFIPGGTGAVSIIFDQIHEYPVRYELLRSGQVISIFPKKYVRLNHLKNIQEVDLINKERVES
jgi:hypothetical protein